MTRRAVWLIAALMIASTVLAADSNQQPARVLDADATHIALAENGGAFMATTEDTGTTGSPDAESFFVWEADGALRVSGSLDPDNCALSECINHPIAVAMSASGNRFAIAAQPGGDGTARLHFGTPTQGIVDVVLLEVPANMTGMDITDIDMDAAGSYIVVTAGLRDLDPDPQEPEPGLVATYKWVGNVVTKQWQTVISNPATSVDVSADGDIAVVTGEKNVRFNLKASSNPGTAFVNQGVPGQARQVAAATGAPHWTVLGTSTGYFALFSDTGNANPSFPEYQARPGTSSAMTAVAITPDASHFALGQADGNLYLYSLEWTPISKVTQQQKLTGLGAVTDLDFSGDGRYLSVAAGNTVRFYEVTTKLDLLWQETLADSLGVVETDTKGERVLAAAGENVLRFDALHQLAIVGESALNSTPTSNVTVDYTLTNSGNRPETMSLLAAGPQNWGVRVDPTAAELAPGESIDVQLLYDVPDGEAPDDYPVALHAVLDSTGATTTKDIVVTIVPTERWSLVLEGATSRGIGAGSSVSYVVKLQNTGNVEADPAFTATVDQGEWTVTHDAPDSLLPGELSLVTVTVAAPGAAPNLQVGKINVAAGDETLALTATVGARFDVSLVTDAPAFEMVAGTELRVPLRITNTGNAVDSYSITAGSVPTDWQIGFTTGASPLQITDLDASQAQTVTAFIRAPVNASTEFPLEVAFTAASAGDRSETSIQRIQITVLAPQEPEEPGGFFTPGPGIGLLVAAIGAAAMVSRRRFS